jgi:hypothetical protein
MDGKINTSIMGKMKSTLRECRSSKSLVIKFGVSILFFIWTTLNPIKRVWVDKEFRSILFLQLLNSRNVHQTTPFTYINRYPGIFSACQNYLDRQNLKILSYGCSTGEEVLTLREYFPNAEIIGAEINKRSLKICRNLQVDNQTTFIYSKQNEIKKHGPYDAIFCMAVLQRKPHYIAEKGISSLKKIYPFEKFEKQIIELDEMVKPGGLLIVHFTQYSFVDTAIASKYTALDNYNHYNLYPLFNKNSQLIKNSISQKSIYIKNTMQF